MKDASTEAPKETTPSVRPTRANILTWYRRNRRDLPWRKREGDAYAQWVAEIMLQQTRVDTVIRYYERFLARFPSVRDLAKAQHETVLKHWEGLGYYRRALHLHAAAKLVCERGGELPRTAAEWRELPGIGEYTSAAIASIAFGEPVAAVDGNVARVVGRLFGITGDAASSAWKTLARESAERLLSRERPGDFNQALMDLGSAVCTPQSPACGVCPVRARCVAFADGLCEEIPNSTKKARVRRVSMTALALICEGRVLMRRRPRGGLWSGLWELPCVEARGAIDVREVAAGMIGVGPKRRSDGATERRRGTEVPLYGTLVKQVSKRAVVVRHQLTHREMVFRAYVCKVGEPDRADAQGKPSPRPSPKGRGGKAGRRDLRRVHARDLRWVDARDLRWVDAKELAKLPVSTAHRKILLALDVNSWVRG